MKPEPKAMRDTMLTLVLLCPAVAAKAFGMVGLGTAGIKEAS